MMSGLGERGADLSAVLPDHGASPFLSLVFFSGQIRAMGTNMDFERILPSALALFVPGWPAWRTDRGLAGGVYVNFLRP